MSSVTMGVLTPAGAGAIGVIALVGDGAWEVVRAAVVRPGGRPLPATPPVPGFWFAKARGEAGDELIVSRLDSEAGEWVEVHGHGGRALTDLVDRLTRAGAVAVDPAQFPRRAPVADARVWPLLERAPTTRTAAILLDQLHGAYLRAEAMPDAAAALAELAGVGAHLVTPWQVVVAGPPNVGKSSLVNALAGYTRSVVAPVAGTTRDVVRTRLAFDGWPVELVDTAGLRATADDLESLGIARAQQALAGADLVLWLIDASAGSPRWPVDADGLPPGRVRVVANKCDLAGSASCGAAARVSAHTQHGIPGLAAAIAAWLVPRPPWPGEGVPYRLDRASADTIVGVPP